MYCPFSSYSFDGTISFSKSHLFIHSGSLYQPKNSYPFLYGLGGITLTTVPSQSSTKKVVLLS